jgi:hypothetical protein
MPSWACRSPRINPPAGRPPPSDRPFYSNFDWLDYGLIYWSINVVPVEIKRNISTKTHVSFWGGRMHAGTLVSNVFRVGPRRPSTKRQMS